MNKPLLIAVLLFAVYSSGISQLNKDSVAKSNVRRQIDSLQRQIKNRKEDTILAKNLCQLSFLYSAYWPDSSMIYARQAIQLSEKIMSPYYLALGYVRLAGFFYGQKDFDSFIISSQKAIRICIENKLYAEELHYRVSLNNVYFHQGNYTAAMEISAGGLATAEKISNKERMAHFNNVLGYIMMKLKNFNQARIYFSTYLQMTQQIQDKQLEAHALLNLADLSVAEKKYPEAIPFIKNALSIYQTYIPPGYVENLHAEVYTYNKLAEVNKLMNKDSAALQYCLLAIQLANKTTGGNQYDIATYNINTGDIYNRLGQPDKALVYLRRGLKIADSIKHRENIRDAYEQLSLSFSIKKMFDSAFVYQQSFYRLKDSILDETSQREIVQRDAELQIERQRRIQQAALLRQQLLRNIIIGISVFAIIIIIMLYKRRRIKQKMIYQQQLNEQQNEMFNLAATVQDKERKRIAEDIHDGLGSVLSAAKLKLSSLEEDKNLLTEEQQEKYLATMSLLDEAATELRNISHNIMPATLSKLGLISALKNITDRISSHSGLLIQFEVHDFNERLEESAEISIYRIVLELLNNIVKHARATKAVVQLIKYPDYINITVEDNGKGFEYKKVSDQNKGIGLGNIESRINYLKGTIDIDSQPGRGTTIIIDIPYTASTLKYQVVGIKTE